ncbi:uncharacterized protein LOC124911448 [Impatiens glandulifera]|uniref:uncharacterized protein LOC124911448 n=1 Tax=Impatiens glandulifera TaxID=253017 RepID=UPI001FB06C81|nr:uncharacterized protein LOC124911448 [Impatiens glandulifera]
MVVKMMRWRPWPPLLSKKFDVRLLIRTLDGYNLSSPLDLDGGLIVEIRWKGPKIALSPFRRTVKRNFTKEARVGENSVIHWDEEFQSACGLSGYKDNVFHPWEISFTLLNSLNQGQKSSKVSIVGTASLNLADFASKSEERDFELSIPIISSGAAEQCGSLSISVSLLEMRIIQESADSVQRSMAPVPSPPHTGEVPSLEKDELSALKAGLRKVKIFTDYVSIRRTKKACREEDGSVKSEDGDFTYPFDSVSSDEIEEGDSDEGKVNSTARKSFSYGTLAHVNFAGGSLYSTTMINGNDEDWVYYSHRRKSDVGCSSIEDSTASVSESSSLQSSKRSILPWRKRKMTFTSPKTKGEPLLKKAYGEEGGDDIDFDRRQLSSDESLSLGWYKTDEESTLNGSSISEFGDDNFAVGSWEPKEITSRDGHMKLHSQVFFASIDQRSERAAGESACTALVAVIADWFQNNCGLMPIKSQFDSLIREGSLEWRNLCDNEIYMERFPDKHFDLETVLQAKMRPLSINGQKSFVGFFHPDGLDEGGFDFLQSAMSFDNIWDEISCQNDPQVYIISWNDHFFILKIESEAYYIIDTLGERLYEGCNQAYILKFDRNSKIFQLPSTTLESSDEKPAEDQQPVAVQQTDSTNKENLTVEEQAQSSTESMEEREVVCGGKESCKEYIKSFLAAIPIRELQADMKKGLASSTPLHQRLQIEFHFTQTGPQATKEQQALPTGNI